MRRLQVFILISVAVHVLLLMINPPEQQNPAGTPTYVDIVPKEPPVTSVTKPPQPPVEVVPPQGVIPNTPEPSEPLPVKPLPQPPQQPKPQPSSSQPPQPSPEPATPVVPGTVAIVPKIPPADRPPAPMTLSEILQELDKVEAHYGPDRRIEDIARDYLHNTPQTPGEDTVSFHNLSDRYESYFYRFARSVYSVWNYPEAAARRGEFGIVRVTFDITKEGKVTNLNMLESSGYPELDREVMRTLRNMESVPLPDSYGLNLLHINGYFIYSLTGEYRLY